MVTACEYRLHRGREHVPGQLAIANLVPSNYRMTLGEPNCDDSSRRRAGKPAGRAFLYSFDDGAERFVRLKVGREAAPEGRRSVSRGFPS
jgi:hypothetical protein